MCDDFSFWVLHVALGVVLLHYYALALCGKPNGPIPCSCFFLHVQCGPNPLKIWCNCLMQVNVGTTNLGDIEPFRTTYVCCTPDTVVFDQVDLDTKNPPVQ